MRTGHYNGVQGIGLGFFLSPPCATHTSSKKFKRFSVARRRSQQMRAKAFVFMYEVFYTGKILSPSGVVKTFSQFNRLLGNYIEPILSRVASVLGLRKFDSVFIAWAENDMV